MTTTPTASPRTSCGRDTAGSPPLFTYTGERRLHGFRPERRVLVEGLEPEHGRRRSSPTRTGHRQPVAERRRRRRGHGPDRDARRPLPHVQQPAKERRHRQGRPLNPTRRHPLPRRRDLRRGQRGRHGPERDRGRRTPARSSPSRRAAPSSASPSTRHGPDHAGRRRQRQRERQLGLHVAVLERHDQRRASTVTATSGRRATPRRAACTDRSPTTCWTATATSSTTTP